MGKKQKKPLARIKVGEDDTTPQIKAINTIESHINYPAVDETSWKAEKFLLTEKRFLVSHEFSILCYSFELPQLVTEWEDTKHTDKKASSSRKACWAFIWKAFQFHHTPYSFSSVSSFSWSSWKSEGVEASNEGDFSVTVDAVCCVCADPFRLLFTQQ